MSNHTHVVLHINVKQAEDWPQETVIEHWHGLFAGTALPQRFLRGEPMGRGEREQLSNQVETWREHLSSVSWYMRCLNEAIARQANTEDGCSGRFWEGRFKCQALLDEAALAACLAYVDLNPIRAGMAESPECSDHTTVQQRLKTLSRDANDTGNEATNRGQQTDIQPHQPDFLYPIVGNPRQPMLDGLPFPLQDYVELLDWTGRIVREDKRGAIPDALPPILQRLKLNAEAWLQLSSNIEQRFPTLVGRPEQIQAACGQLGQRWAHGMTAARRLFSG